MSFFFASQYLQDTEGFTALQAGMGFLPMTAFNFGVAFCAARVIRQIGNGATIMLGVGLTLVAMIWIALAAGHGSWFVKLGLPILLARAGQGLCYGPLTTAAMQVKRRRWPVQQQG